MMQDRGTSNDSTKYSKVLYLFYFLGTGYELNKHENKRAR